MTNLEKPDAPEPFDEAEYRRRAEAIGRDPGDIVRSVQLRLPDGADECVEQVAEVDLGQRAAALLRDDADLLDALAAVEPADLDAKGRVVPA